MGVNWYDSVKWCNARSEMEGRSPAYYTDATQTTAYRTGAVDLVTGAVNWNGGYRLPTEAEWEKAARGGLTGQRFPWGDTISWSQANYAGDPLSLDPYFGYAYDLSLARNFDVAFWSQSWPYTSPAGSFAANGYGLYDMAGNVWQWCWDWYDPNYYNASPGTDPTGPASSPSQGRGARGGSWYHFAIHARSASRFNYVNDPVIAFYYVGFRCVLRGTSAP